MWHQVISLFRSFNKPSTGSSLCETMLFKRNKTLSSQKPAALLKVFESYQDQVKINIPD